MAKVKDDMKNQELLGNIKKFAAKMVWHCLKGNPGLTRRWGERMKCAKWCAEQRGIGMDEIEKYEVAGAHMAVEAFQTGDCVEYVEWMEVLA